MFKSSTLAVKIAVLMQPTRPPPLKTISRLLPLPSKFPPVSQGIHQLPAFTKSLDFVTKSSSTSSRLHSKILSHVNFTSPHFLSCTGHQPQTKNNRCMVSSTTQMSLSRSINESKTTHHPHLMILDVNSKRLLLLSCSGLTQPISQTSELRNSGLSTYFLETSPNTFTHVLLMVLANILPTFPWYVPQVQLIDIPAHLLYSFLIHLRAGFQVGIHTGIPSMHSLWLTADMSSFKLSGNIFLTMTSFMP